MNEKRNLHLKSDSVRQQKFLNGLSEYLPRVQRNF